MLFLNICVPTWKNGDLFEILLQLSRLKVCLVFDYGLLTFNSEIDYTLYTRSILISKLQDIR